MKSEPSPLPGTLKGSLREYRVVEGSDLLRRVDGFYQWQEQRRQEGFWPYGRSTETGPKSACAVADDVGRKSKGVNFGSQDYLSLSNHPSIHQAAHVAIERYGVHSAGSPAFMGNTTHSIALEKKISEFLCMDRVVLYPTGYAAGAGAIKGLVRSSDHVVMDALAHACLQDGAASATKNVYLFRHLDLEFGAALAVGDSRQGHGERHSRRHRRPVLDGFRHARHRWRCRTSATSSTRP